MDISIITSYLSFDFIIIGIAALALAFFALYSGIGRVASLGLASVVTLFLYTLLEDAAWISGFLSKFEAPLMRAGVILVLLAALYIIIARMSGWYGGDDGGKPIQAIAAGCAATALLLVLFSTLPVLAVVWDFGATVDGFFREQYLFWWIFGSLAVLGISNRGW
jgi:hypothetical protein